MRAGKLLVAAPALIDPNFARTVVLLCEFNEDGALGLVLNRPTESPVADFLPMWEPDEPPVVFIGGPVQPEVAVGLVRHRGVEPIGFSVVADDYGLFDLATPPELTDGALAALRVFSGYSGWGSGQLEAEVLNGDWVIVDATLDDLFGPDAHGLWSAVLRRQGGELAMLADFPEDPGLN